MGRIGELKRLLRRKTIDSPVGLEPPNLTAMIDRTLYALTNPGNYLESYLTHLRDDVWEAKRVLDAIDEALPVLEQRTVRKWKRKKWDRTNAKSKG